MSSKNPFLDAFENWTQSLPKSESFDFDKIIAAGKLNAKAFSEAAKAASEGAQALSRRQAEIIQNNAEEFSKLFKEISSVKKPEDGAAKQVEFAKKTIESSIADSKELLELAAKSSGQATEILSQRFSSAVSEFSSEANAAAKKANKAA